jgi:hypothetical protein
MSWDICLQNIPNQYKSLDDIPDDYKSLSIGPRDDIIKKLKEFNPMINFSDPTWGILTNSDISIEISVGNNKDCDTISIYAHDGNSVPEFVCSLMDFLGLRGIDLNDPQFIDIDSAKSSYQKWLN